MEKSLIKSNYINRFSIFALLFWFAMLFPTFNMYLDRIGAMIINGLLMMVSIVLIYKYTRSTKDYIIREKYLKLFFYLWLAATLIMIVSYPNGMFFANISIIQRDLYDLYKPLFYISIFTLTYLSIQDITDIKRYEKLLQVFFFILLITAVVQFFRFIPEILLQYTKTHNVKTGRVSVPFVNPYDYAFIVSFFAYYFIIKYIYTGKKISLFLFILATFMILSTQSRSILGSYIIGLFIILPLLVLYLNRNKIINLKLTMTTLRFLVVFFLIILLVVWLVIYILKYFPYIVYGFQTILSGEKLNSANTRLEQMIFAIESASRHPMLFLFGHGPSKGVMEYVETYYTYAFYRYGIVGLFILLVFPLLLTIHILFKILKILKPTHNLYGLFAAILIWFIIMPISLIGNNFIEQLRISFFYYSILAIVLKSYILLKKEQSGISINNNSIV